MKLKRFTYSLRQDPSSGPFVQFDIRLQNHRAKIGLAPDDTVELWITCAEMPTVVADMVDERTWDGPPQNYFGHACQSLPNTIPMSAEKVHERA